MTRQFGVRGLFCLIVACSATQTFAIDIQALIDDQILKYELDNNLPPGSLSVLDRRQIKMPKIVVPAGVHTITKPLDCRGFWGLTIEGEGYGSQIKAQFDPQYIGYPMIDATGAFRMTIRDIRIWNGPSAQENGGAGIGVLFARFASSASSGWHRMDTVQIHGPFTTANLVVVGSESNSYAQVECSNYSAAGNCILITTSDLGGTIKSLEPLGLGSMLTGLFKACVCAKLPSEAGTLGAAISLKTVAGAAVGNIHFIGGNLSMRQFQGEGGVAGETMILMESASGNQLQNCSFKGVRSEGKFTDHFIKVVAPLPTSVPKIHIGECEVYTKESAIVYPGFMDRWSITRTQFSLDGNCTGGTCPYSIVETDRLFRCDLDFLYGFTPNPNNTSGFPTAVTVTTFAADSNITIDGLAVDLVAFLGGSTNNNIYER